MNYAQKQAVIKSANERRGAISAAKGPEYSQAGSSYQDDGVDVLANFRRNAEKLGMHPVQILALYLNKHVDSYDTFIRSFGEIAARTHDHSELGTLAGQGEGIISRLDDIRNYVDLLECLLIDEQIVPEHVVGRTVGWAGVEWVSELDPEPTLADAVLPDDYVYLQSRVTELLRQNADLEWELQHLRREDGGF